MLGRTDSTDQSSHHADRRGRDDRLRAGADLEAAGGLLSFSARTGVRRLTAFDNRGCRASILGRAVPAGPTRHRHVLEFLRVNYRLGVFPEHHR